MSVVVDASTAVKWVISERGSDAALALLRDEGEELIVPSLWFAEVANALWKIARTGNITTEESAVRFLELSDAPITVVAIEPHMPAALALAIELNHAFYDWVYLAVAIFQNTHVVTDDRRFAASVAGSPHLADRVRLLGT